MIRDVFAAASSTLALAVVACSFSSRSPRSNRSATSSVRCSSETDEAPRAASTKPASITDHRSRSATSCFCMLFTDDDIAVCSTASFRSTSTGGVGVGCAAGALPAPSTPPAPSTNCPGSSVTDWPVDSCSMAVSSSVMCDWSRACSCLYISRRRARPRSACVDLRSSTLIGAQPIRRELRVFWGTQSGQITVDGR